MSYISRTKPLSRIQKRFNSWSIVRKKGSILEDITNRVQFFESFFFFWKKMNSLSHNFCLKKSIFRVVLKLGSIVWVILTKWVQFFESYQKKSSIFLRLFFDPRFNSLSRTQKRNSSKKFNSLTRTMKKKNSNSKTRKEFNSLCLFFLKKESNSLRHIWKKGSNSLRRIQEKSILCVKFKKFNGSIHCDILKK